MSLAETTKDVLKAFETFDSDTILSKLDDDFEFQMLPMSLGVRPKHKKDYVEWLCSLKMPTALLKLEILDLVTDNDTTIVHLRNKGRFPDGSFYSNEYMIMFRFRAGKVVTMKEFVDSAFMKTIAHRLRIEIAED